MLVIMIPGAAYKGTASGTGNGGTLNMLRCAVYVGSNTSGFAVAI